MSETAIDDTVADTSATPTPGTSGLKKRKFEVDPQDPDNGNAPPNPIKIPKIDVAKMKKASVLRALARGYELLMNAFWPDIATTDEKWANVTISSRITATIYSLHHSMREEANGNSTNLGRIRPTPLKIHHNGVVASVTIETARTAWITACAKYNLVYKKFEEGSEEEWYETIGPYLDCFLAHYLRLRELRMGYKNMVIKKTTGKCKYKIVPLKRYGIQRMHRILLDGVTYPPEIRSSMAQYIGPLTVFLCMLKAESQDREKWEIAVKRALAGSEAIETIDDIVSLTRKNKKAKYLAPIVKVLSYLTIIESPCKANRLYMPLNMFYKVLTLEEDDEKFLNFFSLTDSGAYYAYKRASEHTWVMDGKFTTEQASQLCFHGIFGTFQEDLRILGEVTNTPNWLNRMQFGPGLQGTTNSVQSVPFRLPVFKYYSKLTTTSQTELLASAQEVSPVPAFSGRRPGDNHVKRRRIQQKSRFFNSTIQQILISLDDAVEDCLIILQSPEGNPKRETCEWFSMDSLNLDKVGEPLDDIVLRSLNVFFHL